MMGNISSIIIHLKVKVVVSHPSDWLIPFDDCVMPERTKWEGVVQMILRSCVYLVQKRPNFTLFGHSLSRHRKLQM